MLKHKFWYSLIPSIIWAIVIAVGSFIPSSTIPSVVVFDKWFSSYEKYGAMVENVKLLVLPLRIC